MAAAKKRKPSGKSKRREKLREKRKVPMGKPGGKHRHFTKYVMVPVVAVTVLVAGARGIQLVKDHLKYRNKPTMTYVNGVRTYLTDKRPEGEKPVEYYKYSKDRFWARMEGPGSALLLYIPTEFFRNNINKPDFIRKYGDLRFKSVAEAARVLPEKIFKLIPKELTQKERDSMVLEHGSEIPLAALEKRKGSCWERASIMCAILRANGFAARIVGFYGLKPRLIGREYTHYWVEVYDPKRGWVAVPTTKNRQILRPRQRYFTRRSYIAGETTMLEMLGASK